MLGSLNGTLSSFHCGMKIWRNGSISLLRRLHEKSTTLLNEVDVKMFEKNAHLFSAMVEDSCPATGQTLSSIHLPVRLGPPIPIEVLSPSLLQFMKDVVNGLKFEGALHKAFNMLERGLVSLSDTKTKSGLSQTFNTTMNGILELRRKTRAEINAEIAENIILPLMDGFIILNASHRDITTNAPLYPPESRGWKGLGLGHPSAWYGEIDMLVCNALASDDCQIAVILEDSDDEDRDSDDEDMDSKGLKKLPEASLAVEGNYRLPNKWSLQDGLFGQGFATSVTYSFTYHYGHSHKASFVPTIQVSPEGFQVFLYDCRSDIMLTHNFGWNRSSLIFLWAILHYHLFFPPTISRATYASLFSFGYSYPRPEGFKGHKGFHALKKDQFYFGLHKNSKEFQRRHSQLGRLFYLQE